MSVHVLWRRLDTPGHDAAFLTRTDTGWALEGTAVFRHEAGPAAIRYAVDIDPSWIPRRGTVRGRLAGGEVDHVISREPDGWHLDGRPVGLGHLLDLDFGFTPATNLQQLRRTAPAPGATVEFSVAWFDLGETTLTELPQIYTCRDARTFDYRSPQSGYEAVLELADTGFVRNYPQLWTMDS